MLQATFRSTEVAVIVNDQFGLEEHLYESTSCAAPKVNRTQNLNIWIFLTNYRTHQTTKPMLWIYFSFHGFYPTMTIPHQYWTTMVVNLLPFPSKTIHLLCSVFSCSFTYSLTFFSPASPLVLSHTDLQHGLTFILWLSPSCRHTSLHNRFTLPGLISVPFLTLFFLSLSPSAIPASIPWLAMKKHHHNFTFPISYHSTSKKSTFPAHIIWPPYAHIRMTTTMQQSRQHAHHQSLQFKKHQQCPPPFQPNICHLAMHSSLQKFTMQNPNKKSSRRSHHFMGHKEVFTTSWCNQSLHHYLKANAEKYW